MSDERTVIELAHPVQFGQETITELHMRPGRVEDVKGIRVGADGVVFDDLIKVASRMCGQPIKVLEKLREDDAGKVLVPAMHFLGRCLSTGIVPSES